jgi:hypothetical protein
MLALLGIVFVIFVAMRLIAKGIVRSLAAAAIG